MRMEFRKLDGEETFPHKLLAESFDPKPGELLQFAKNSLNGFYEGDERVFWPKPKHISRAPEEVRIVNDEATCWPSIPSPIWPKTPKRTWSARSRSR